MALRSQPLSELPRILVLEACEKAVEAPTDAVVATDPVGSVATTALPFSVYVSPDGAASLTRVFDGTQGA